MGDERWPFVDFLEGTAMPRCCWTRSCQRQPLRKRKLTATFSNFLLGMCQHSQLIVQNLETRFIFRNLCECGFPHLYNFDITNQFNLLNDSGLAFLESQPDFYFFDLTLHVTLPWGQVTSQREKSAFNGAICHPENNQCNICCQAPSIPDFG